MDDKMIIVLKQLTTGLLSAMWTALILTSTGLINDYSNIGMSILKNFGIIMLILFIYGIIYKDLLIKFNLYDK